MTKTQLLAPYANNDALRLCLARLLDCRDRSEARGQRTCTSFLTPEERSEAELLLSRLSPVKQVFFGGFSGAERQVCVFLPDWMDEDTLHTEEDSPLCALDVQLPAMAKTLTHRDYLGSLMALGLKRETCGDILCHAQGAQLLLLRDRLPILLSQWDKVAQYPLRLQEIPLAGLTAPVQNLAIVRDTVASLRLDSVVAAGFSLSRTRASELIAQGRVEKNHRVCDKTDAAVQEGDVFSCRGLGKFRLHSAGGQSRKGRIFLELHRFV